MLIDTHFHIWQRAKIPWLREAAERLQRDVAFADYEAEYASVGGFTGGIFIEANAANAAEETRAVAELMKSESKILGICTASTECLAMSEVKSFRAVLHVREDNYCRSEGFRQTLAAVDAAALPFEACLREGVISSFADVSEGFGSRIIVNHFCNVTRPDACSQGVKRLAARANSVLKLSCMDDFSPATDADFLRALLQMALDLYGEDRLIFGSNFPVSALRPAAWLEFLGGFFSPRVLEKILYHNAKEVYKL